MVTLPCHRHARRFSDKENRSATIPLTQEHPEDFSALYRVLSIRLWHSIPEGFAPDTRNSHLVDAQMTVWWMHWFPLRAYAATEMCFSPSLREGSRKVRRKRPTPNRFGLVSAVSWQSRPSFYPCIGVSTGLGGGRTATYLHHRYSRLHNFFGNCSKFIANSFGIHRSLFPYSDLWTRPKEKALPGPGTTVLPYIASSNCLREARRVENLGGHTRTQQRAATMPFLI